MNTLHRKIVVTLSMLVANVALAQAIDSKAEFGLSAVPDPYADVDLNVLKTDKLTLDVGGMFQALGQGQIVNDPVDGNDRVYLFMPKARLRIDAAYEQVSFNLQLALGGEDSVNGTSGIDFSMLDMAINIPLVSAGKTYLKVGQFLVPYGREQLTDPGFQELADTSMEEIGFVVGRDVGLAVVSRPGPLSIVAGVFTGGGRDIPPDHYLPLKLGVPELVARIGVGNLEENPFYLRQSDGHVDHFEYEVSVNALYTKDSVIGHSTVLNVKGLDKSILIDANWNPFIAQGGVGKYSQGEYWQAGGDAAVRSPIGGGWTFAGEAQLDFAGYSNSYGSLSIWGARIQAGVLHDPIGVAVRYDILGPSNRFVNGGVIITGAEPIQEVAPALTWRVIGDNVKVIFDFPLLINTPVFTEPSVGQYVGTQLQDESTLVAPKAGGSVGRQTIPQARLMLQGQF